jgi:hypothetical protein
MFVGDRLTRSFQGTICLYKNKASARNKNVPERIQGLCLSGAKAVKYGVIHQCHDPACSTHCISSGEMAVSMWTPVDLPSDVLKRIGGP